MRTPLLSLAAVALVASACSGNSTTMAPSLALSDIAASAFGEAEGLPPTDEVHAFLDLLDQLARMDG